MGIAAAAAGFTVLTAGVQQSRLQVVGTVEQNSRSAYDILVRPKGGRSGEEKSSDLVRGDFLAGSFGGISPEQLAAVRALPGVQVAAPLQLVGYVELPAQVPVDVSRFLRPGQAAAFRVSVSWRSDRGLSRAAQRPPYTVYVTPNPLAYAMVGGDPTLEKVASGRSLPVCPYGGKASLFATLEPLWCWSTQEPGRDGTPQTDPLLPHPGVLVPMTYPVLLAAVDPAAEQALSGLGDAVTKGRYLRAGDTFQGPNDNDPIGIPVLASTAAPADLQAQISVESLGPAAVARIRADAGPDALSGLPGTLLSQRTVSGQQGYDEFLRAGRSKWLQAYWTAGTAKETSTTGGLRPEVMHNPDSVWRQGLQAGSQFEQLPSIADDVEFRRLTAHRIPDPRVLGTKNPYPAVQVVGQFDPSRLGGTGTALTRVPLGLADDAVLAPADAAATRALGGRPLLPSPVVAGYEQQPPTLITTMQAAQPFYWHMFGKTARSAPISSIRVKVTGVNGVDPVSRERVRLVAEQISTRTGLDVDITAGSSPTGRTIVLPAGRHGRPQLTLSQQWVKKGVALSILSQVDKKSLLLFLTVLLVCAVFVVNATTAAVQGRRRELGTLAAVGWPRRALLLLVLGQVVLAGALAGVAGAALSLLIGPAAGLPVPATHALLAVPAAVLVAALAAAVPALRAGGTSPMAALLPAARSPRRPLPARGVASLAVANIRAVRGRTVLAAAGLAVAVAAFTLLVAVTLAFHGALVGSLLGDAVDVQVRAVDWAAAAATLLLAALGVGDAVYISVLERAPQLATLRAVGWTEAALTRMLLVESLATGLLGALAGGLLGTATAVALAGQLSPAVLLAPVAGLLVAAAVSAAAALLPARLLARTPTPQLLATE